MRPRTFRRATTRLRAKRGPRQLRISRRNVRTARRRKLAPYQPPRDHAPPAAISGTGTPPDISTRPRPERSLHAMPSMRTNHPRLLRTVRTRLTTERPCRRSRPNCRAALRCLISASVFAPNSRPCCIAELSVIVLPGLSKIVGGAWTLSVDTVDTSSSGYTWQGRPRSRCQLAARVRS